MKSEISENTKIPVFIGFGKIASGHMGANTEMVALGTVRLENDNQGAQPFTVGKLSEHQRQQLVPACEILDVTVTAIFSDDTVKKASVKKRNQLGKDKFFAKHTSIGMFLAENFQVRSH